jgi:hypothetical protein
MKPERENDGTFKPGISGNPAGRPKSPHHAVILEQLAQGKGDVVKTVLEAAIKGDMSACKLVLDRLLPPLKSVSQTVSLNLPDSSSPLEIARSILATTAAGGIPPDIAGQLVTALGTLCRIEEIEELRHRIAALEKATLSQIKKP